jgi:hypothetical protein
MLRGRRSVGGRLVARQPTQDRRPTHLPRCPDATRRLAALVPPLPMACTDGMPREDFLYVFQGRAERAARMALRAISGALPHTPEPGTN